MQAASLVFLSMRNAKQNLVLFHNSLKGKQISSELASCETIRYQAAESMEQLQSLLERQVRLISFSAPPLALALTVANLRSLLGLGGLIVVVNKAKLSEQITDLLLAGADIVLDDESLTVTELLTWESVLVRRADGFLRAQSRHELEGAQQAGAGSLIARHQSKPAATPWYLVDGGWGLKDPQGNLFDLTTGERFFLESFVGQIDKRVQRNELIEKNATLNENSRAIDSLISRLRRKLRQKNSHLPIKAVHGWGYSFNGLLLDESKAQLEKVKR